MDSEDLPCAKTKVKFEILLLCMNYNIKTNAKIQKNRNLIKIYLKSGKNPSTKDSFQSIYT